jgi:hypothetical protein
MNELFRTIANAISGPARTREARKTTCRVGLNVENLGERLLLSVSPIHAVAVEPPMAQLHPIPLPHHRWDVPNLKGYIFALNSTYGGSTHAKLVITSETYKNASGSFTGTWGTWQGDGRNSHAVSGTLVFKATVASDASVKFSWTNGKRGHGHNSFSGTLNVVQNGTGECYLAGNIMWSNFGAPETVGGYGNLPGPHGSSG